MHMADALLSPAVGVSFYAVSAGILALAARRTASEPGFDRLRPLMGVLGAFVFAAQMINFAIPGTGSSGHLGGGLLLALLLGPYAAFLTIASVLIIQCLFFADGGLLALGCNIFNMGFWPAFVGLPLIRLVTGGQRSFGRLLAGTLPVAVLCLLLGAFGVVIETLLSGRTELPFSVFSLTMLGIHAPIGIVEGLVTASVVAAIDRLIPALTRTGDAVPMTTSSRTTALVTLFGCALFAGAVLAWFPSSKPDGLEWSIGKVTGKDELPEQEGAFTHALKSIQNTLAFMPDYDFTPSSGNPSVGSAGAEGVAADPASEADPAWPNVSGGTSAAGAVGAGLTAVLILLGAWGITAWGRIRGRHPDRVARVT